jgi:hypothetical protein
MMQPGVAIDRPVKWLTADYNALKALHDNVININNGKIKNLFANAKLVEIL